MLQRNPIKSSTQRKDQSQNRGESLELQIRDLKINANFLELMKGTKKHTNLKHGNTEKDSGRCLGKGRTRRNKKKINIENEARYGEEDVVVI